MPVEEGGLGGTLCAVAAKFPPTSPNHAISPVTRAIRMTLVKSHDSDNDPFLTRPLLANSLGSILSPTVLCLPCRTDGSSSYHRRSATSPDYINNTVCYANRLTNDQLILQY